MANHSIKLTNKGLGRLILNGTDMCAKCNKKLKSGLTVIKKRGTRKQKWYHTKCFEALHY